MAAGKGQIRQRRPGGNKSSKLQKQSDDDDDPSPSSSSTAAAAAARRAIASKQRRRGVAAGRSSSGRNVRIGAAVVAVVVIVSISIAWSSGRGRTSSNDGIIGGGIPPELLANDTEWDRTDPKLNATHRFLSDFVCTAHGGFCHPHLEPVPTRRTHRVTATVDPGAGILVLPRHLQIWDLDALRDSFVRAELLGTTHGPTGNALDAGAYLAAYLVRRHKLARGEWGDDNGNGNDNDEDEVVAEDDDAEDDPLLPYLDMLPTYADHESYHPTLWSPSDLTSMLGRYSPATVLVTAYRDMMESEFRALLTASDEFSAHVARDEYVAARLNVLSRSFGTGPPPPEEARISAEGMPISLEDEMEYYDRVADIDLSKGCRAMTPILDAWDSHPHPNARWTYDRERRAFVVAADAARGIPSGHDVIVSYGTYTESHLFAKFGYVNGDGSSYTEAFINSIHRLLDLGLQQQFSYVPFVFDDDDGGRRNPKQGEAAVEEQKSGLVRYLQFDDGYQECIKPSNNEEEESSESNDDAAAAWTLKKLKFRHLEAIANIRDRWVMKVAPRDPDSGPGASSAVPITAGAPMFDPQKMKFNANHLAATCRLMVLTHHDYDGDAIRVLTDVLANDTAHTFVVERQSDALEYRTVSCIVRLVDMMLWRYPSRVAKDMRMLSSLPMPGVDDEEEGEEESRPTFRSREWSAAHVRLGEMQSLEVLGGTMKVAGRQLRERAERELSAGSSSLVVRRKPCVLEDTLAILDLKTRMMGENYVKSTRTFERAE